MTAITAYAIVLLPFPLKPVIIREFPFPTRTVCLASLMQFLILLLELYERKAPLPGKTLKYFNFESCE